MFARRRRIVGLALIALAVPFPALAIDGGGESNAPASLSVSASLAGCGLAETQILCQIDAGWNAIEGAEHYQVSVIAPDGSVSDQGQTGGQASSAWATYVGPGTYTVQVTAWGTPPGETEPEVIARDSAEPAPLTDKPSSGPRLTDDPKLSARDEDATDQTESESIPELTEDPAPIEPPACGEEATRATASEHSQAVVPAEEKAAAGGPEPADQTAPEPPADPACP